MNKKYNSTNGYGWSWSNSVKTKSYHNKHAIESKEFATVKSHSEQCQEAQNHSKQAEIEESSDLTSKDKRALVKLVKTSNLLDSVYIDNNGRKVITNDAIAYKLGGRKPKWIIKFFDGSVKFVYNLVFN